MGHLNAPTAFLSAAVALSCGCNADPAQPSHRVESPAQEQRQERATFTNPLYKGQDPAFVKHDGWYYLCQSAPGNGIQIYKSRKLTDRGESKRVWSAPRTGPNSRQIWAPELHFIRGKWFIYYAASNGVNDNHRMYVLEAATDDPQGDYIDRGVLYTGDDIVNKTKNRWAIDGTVLGLHEKLYFIWSGWEGTADVQHLYIARMENPATIASERVKLCDNDTHVWERVGERESERGLHEGPVPLVRNGKVFLVYSASGSWQRTYKLGMLHMDQSADPIDPESWTKVERPVFESTRETFGVGHCCFVKSPDDREDWIAYHSKVSRREGWDRIVNIQPFKWDDRGFPDFGQPLPPNTPIPVPSGEEGSSSRTPASGGALIPSRAAASPDGPR